MTRAALRASRRLRAAGIVAGSFALVAVAAAAPPRVVPWLDRHPARASAQPPLAAPCRASSLHADLFLQGATGSLVGGVTFRNAGTRPCSLLGRPRVSLGGAAARAAKWRVKPIAAAPLPVDVLADPPGSLRALQPGKSARMTLFWSNWCGPGATPTGDQGRLPAALDVRLASATTVRIRLSQAPRCDAPQYPSTISVGPFTPTERRLPERSRLPLRVAVVGGRHAGPKGVVPAFEVRRGERFRYEISVTNTGRTAFRFARTSCPSYVEQLSAERQEVYVLNCRPLGAIAPRASVRFAMQIAIPSDARLGVNSLTWQLAPKTYEAPFAPATLRVVR